ncbi:MAG: hypothetical protein CHACPFDD_03270 [Phycisphaerae bacterium]|nr:hypothetical protein [Phycisphaerae bacterium]
MKAPWALLSVTAAAAVLAGCPTNTDLADNSADSSQHASDVEPGNNSIPAPGRLSPGERVDGTSTTLRWNASGAPDYYALHLGTENPPHFLYNLTSTSYSADGLALCATYFWRVDAHWLDGRSAASEVYSFRTACPADKPDAPLNPSPAHDDVGVPLGTALNWSAAPRAERYDVYFGSTPTPAYLASAYTPALASLPDVREGRTYYWRVVAVNADGVQSSRQWQFRTTADSNAPRPAVAAFPADGASGLPTRLRLEWTGSPGALRYRVHFGTAADPPALGTTIDTDFTTPAELALDTVYYWRVVAEGELAETASDVWSFRTAATHLPPLVPDRPQPEDGAAGVPADTVLRWRSVPDADSYDVLLGEHTAVYVATVFSAEFRPSAALRTGSLYAWQVVARNVHGSTAGPIWAFATGGATGGGDGGGAGGGGGGAGGGGGGGSSNTGLSCPSSLARVNLTPSQEQSTGGASRPAVSANGQFVAFVSSAADLVPGDTNGVADAFVCELATGTVTRVSLTSDGAQSPLPVDNVSISGDGALVAFETAARLAGADADNLGDVYVHSCVTGETRLISLAPDDESRQPALSADGSSIALACRGGPSGAAGIYQIYAVDLATGQAECVSVSSGGAAADRHVLWPALSADGRVAAFGGDPTNLAAGGNGYSAYVRDRNMGQTRWVDDGGAGALTPTISGDGHVVAFTGGDSQIYAVAMPANTLERVSRSSGGEAGNEASWLPRLSQTGRFVTFSTLATNLGVEKSADQLDVVRVDRASGAMQLISIGIDGSSGNRNSVSNALSAAGDVIAFISGATDLVPGDTNGQSDVFVGVCD